jgi:RNA recognition motif-containing protein
MDGYKLFIGNLPPDVTDGELLKVFAEHGELLEVFIMGGERSRSGQSSAFVKYATFESCEKAINSVNLKIRIRSTDIDPIIVKHAKLPTTTTTPPIYQPLVQAIQPIIETSGIGCKLFVGGLGSFVDRDDLIAIFCPFGHIDSVHLMNGKSKSGQSCAFITYQYQGPAKKAIEILAGKYFIDEDCPPISVRFADSEIVTSVNLPASKRIKKIDGLNLSTIRT